MRTRILFVILIAFSITTSAQNITTFEYFFDSDPGIGLATSANPPASPTINDFTISIPVSSLSTGFHTLYLRGKNTTNEWTHTHFRTFYIVQLSTLSADITQLEYFVDTDPGVGLATQVTGFSPATAITNVPINLDVSTLATGFHTIYVRGKNTSGEWTHTHFRTFYIVPLSTLSSDITQIEYFVDTDPGVGLATQVTGFSPTATIANLPIDLVVSAYPQGFHTLYVRSKNTSGEWSHTHFRNFYIVNNLPSTDNLVKFEYFFDTDPGFENGTAVPVAPPAPTVTNQDIFADASSLSIGSHTIYVRAKDSGGEWTQVSTGSFSVTAALPPTITSFIPTSASAGTTVTITGTDFTGATDVSFGGTAATSFTVVSATSITAVVGTGTSGNVSVTTPSGTANLAGFIFLPAPSITSFTPTSGSAGTTVTITGTDFTGATDVSLGGTAATSFTVVSSTSIAAVVGTGTSGTISVSTLGGIATSTTAFTITIPTTITISPQPVSVATCDGSTTSFTLAAAGTTNLAYQWQKFNGTVFTDLTNDSGYSGTTSATLSINTAVTFGAGDYRCKISGDSAADVFSDTVTLSIDPIPTAPTTPVGASVCGTGSAIVSVSGGTNGQYRWYTSPTGGTAILGEVNDSYTTPILSTTTDYYVSINNGPCESSRTAVTATLLTTTAPTALNSGSACLGSVVTLTASGGLEGQYSWYTLATGGTAIPGEKNSTYQIPSLTTTSTFYVSLTIGGCESTRTPVTATVLTIGCAPVITAQTLTTQVEGKIEINLQSLITTPGTLDPASIKVVTQPASGAIASITNFVLSIDYKGKPFSGTESVLIEACNTNGLCSQQVFTIEVAGEVIVFNAMSPNNDGKNEFLVLQYIESISPNNQISIYNRWGDEVFSISNYDNKTRVFSGFTAGGNKLPSGTYFYKISLIDANKTLTGFISLKH